MLRPLAVERTILVANPAGIIATAGCDRVYSEKASRMTRFKGRGDVRNAVRDAHKDGKRVVLMRLKSDETTKFVAVPIARA